MPESDICSAVRKRRLDLGLTYQDIGKLKGPSSPTMLGIETGRKRSYRASTLRKLNTVLQWPEGHAEELARAAAEAGHGKHIPSPVEVSSRIEHLRRGYRGLLDAGAHQDSVAAAADVLAYVLVPQILVQLQQLQPNDLYELDSDDILQLDEIFGSGGDRGPTAAESEHPPNAETDGRASRTVAHLADGRVIAVKSLRVERGLSQDQVAKAVTQRRRTRDPQAKAVAISTISGIEIGERGAGTALTRDLEAVYKLSRGAINKQW